ncbi:MAG: DUF1501 domain-containing protein, partial [Pirellulales bacterium]|nr:DUF1501 domain-containing protein [Pirellulales bacterium]
MSPEQPAGVSLGSGGQEPCRSARRRFLWELGAGFGGLALTDLLRKDGFFAPAVAAGEAESSLVHPLAERAPHFAPRAKHVIFLFMYGGPTSMDSWDYKPELQSRHGQTVDIEIRRRSIQKQKLLGSQRKFAQHGQSGMWGSDAFPWINRCLDEICVVKSLYADTFAHGSAMIQMNSGRIIQGHPTVGSWVGYGLGSVNDNLPGYVVML